MELVTITLAVSYWYLQGLMFGVRRESMGKSGLVERPDCKLRVRVGEHLVGGYYTAYGYRGLGTVDDYETHYQVDQHLFTNKEKAALYLTRLGLDVSYLDELQYPQDMFPTTLSRRPY